MIGLSVIYQDHSNQSYQLIALCIYIHMYIYDLLLVHRYDKVQKYQNFKLSTLSKSIKELIARNPDKNVYISLFAKYIFLVFPMIFIDCLLFSVLSLMNLHLYSSFDSLAFMAQLDRICINVYLY